MALVDVDQWRPTGVEDLEPDAWRALRHEGSTTVVAGPGAGKTEFLAQRAAFLLQTGICASPLRILAISFKRDAAENLAARVAQRCPPALARRFVSMTFDAFTKGMVDRFLGALPAAWRPTHPYEVVTRKKKEVAYALTTFRQAAIADWRADIAGLDESKFEAEVVGSTRLPLDRWTPRSGREFAVTMWWAEHLRRKSVSALTFVLINRLAELLLRARPEIVRALRLTYPFIFVDEFQDTTFAQYDFLDSAFRDPRATVTAVGDPKQRIMVWAGARADAFASLQKDFAAKPYALRLNHRSCRELVRIQHVVARAIDPLAAAVTATPRKVVEGDVAQIWRFADEASEGSHVAAWLAKDLASRSLKPRDYAILVKQTAEEFEAQLAPACAQVGLALRNEAKRLGRTTLQDLLVEELTRVAVAIMRLAAFKRAPEAWATASEAILRIRGLDADDHQHARKAERELVAFARELRGRMNEVDPGAAAAQSIAKQVLAFLGLPAIAGAYAEYGSGDSLAIAVEGLLLHLAASSEGAKSWGECLDAFEGVGKVPLMTVHKSKGLEYDTVVFVGLDDSTWWSHRAGDAEGTATFFVALSRAKQRAIFTFCSGRGQRVKVADLYKLLRDAGVPELAF